MDQEMNMRAIFAVINYCLSSVHYCEDPSHIYFLTHRFDTKILP